MTDEFDDGFEDIPRDTPNSKLAPCSMLCAEIGRTDGDKKARRVSITFRTDRLPNDVVAVLDGPRFAIAYNPAMGVIRIKACDDGQYQLTRAPQGRSANPLNTYLLRFPFPARGMTWCAVRTEITLDVNEGQRAILIDVPAQFRAPEPRRLPAPVAQPATPAPVKTSAGPPEDDLMMLRALGVTRKFPRALGGQAFTVSETCLLEALYRRERVSRYGLLVATHKPGADEDDRDERVVDVLISNMRTRLSAMGLAVLNDRDGAFRLSPQHRQRIRELLIAEGHDDVARSGFKS